MRPSGIRVFDGLRVTTEHVDHLQAAIDGTVRDLREIVGLGQVHWGFDVTSSGREGVDVEPGLAFDRSGNRVVADDRQTLAVEFANGETTKYVCVEHRQIEAGEVEGVGTLLFDSSTIYLSSEPPSPGEAAIALAQIVRAETDPSLFKIVDASAPGGAVPETPPEAAAPDAGPEVDIESAPMTEPVPEEPTQPGTMPEGETPDADLMPGAPTTDDRPPDSIPTRIEEEELSAGRPGDDDNTEDGPPAQLVLGAPEPAQPAGVAPIRSGRGLVDLGPRSGTSPSLAALAADLQGSSDVRVPLGQAELQIDFDPAWLTTDCVASVRLELPGDERDESVERPSGTLVLEATAHGETTFAANELDEHGLTTVEASLVTAAGAEQRWTTVTLAERSIACFDMEAILANQRAAELEPVGGALARIQILLETARSSPRLVVRCWLIWKGEVDGDLIELLTAAAPTLDWSARVAWRGVGHQPPPA